MNDETGGGRNGTGINKWRRQLRNGEGGSWGGGGRERRGTFFYRGGNAHQSSTESDGDRKREGSGWGCHLSSCHCCHPWCLWKAAILCAVWCETRSYKSVPLLIACVRARIRVGECWCAGWMDEGAPTEKAKCYIRYRVSIRSLRFWSPNQVLGCVDGSSQQGEV